MRVLIIGCGYVGLTAGARLSRAGHKVTGVRRARSDDSDAAMREAGIRPLYLDITQPGFFSNVRPNYDWVLNCISSSTGTPDDYRRTYLDVMRHVLDWLTSNPPKKFVYTSSTSVYGQIDGSVVTETSRVEPLTDTSKILLETEQHLLKAASGENFPGVVLRLAGIYGPDRCYWLRSFLESTASIENDGRRILNMIHREDAAGAAIAALEKGKPGEIYNAVDDEPVTQIDFFNWLSKRLGRSLPLRSELPTARKRGMTNKRVSNLKLKTELDYVFEYPTFREGYGKMIERNPKSEIRSPNTNEGNLPG